MIDSHVSMLVGMKKGSLKIVGQRVYKFENTRVQNLKDFVKIVGYRASADLIFVTATFPYMRPGSAPPIFFLMGI